MTSELVLHLRLTVAFRSDAQAFDPTLGLRRQLAEPFVARSTELSRDPSSFGETYLAVKETLSRVTPQGPDAVASANVTTDVLVLAFATTTNCFATQPIEV